MRHAENIRQVEQAGADFIGFIFHPPSPRFVEHVPAYLPQRARRVGVFVNATDATIVQTASRFGLDAVQLHGSEPPAQCQRLRAEGLEVIKAISVGAAPDVAAASAYATACDLLLFDTKTPHYGGSGQQFDWSALNAYDGPLPFLLSGGIGPASLDALRRFAHPLLAGYDLNSGVETAPAQKDPQLIRQFISHISHP